MNFTSLDNLKRSIVNTAAGSTVAQIAAVTGKRIKVFGLFFTLATSTTVNFKSATTTLTGDMTLTSLTLDPMTFGGNMFPYFQTAVGEALNMTYGGTVQCSGIIYYTDCDA